MRIQHNLMSMNTHRQLGINQSSQAKSTEKLSSGYRINRAGDDAAGLSISEKMRAQIRGLDRASANAQDGISLIQAAEGALQESHSILQRMRELAVQGANDVNGELDRQAIVDEVNQLGVELDRIASTTNFNGKYILSGAYDKAGAENAYTNDSSAWVTELREAGFDKEDAKPLNIQVGANTMASNVIQISIKGVGAADLIGTEWTDVSAYENRLNPRANAEGFVPSDALPNSGVLDSAGLLDAGEATEEVTTSGFQQLINVIDGKQADGNVLDADAAKTGIALVNELRSTLGAVQNRLEHTVANVDTVSENMQSAESRIRDVDMAKEMMNYTTQNILNQAATAMLAQANQAPQNVLSLIR